MIERRTGNREGMDSQAGKAVGTHANSKGQRETGNMKINNFEEIESWQLARELTRKVYRLTSKKGFVQDFGLKKQIQNAASSVMNNIAEGFDSDTNAEFLRFGQMHRNTYIQSPGLLSADLQALERPGLFFAGQICGVEGYVESFATGLLAGINAARLAQGRAPVFPPRATACGSLVHYICHAPPERFEPANVSFGILSESPAGFRPDIRDKKERHRIQVQEALARMDAWIESLGT